MAPIRCCFDQTAVWHSDAARGPSTPSFNHLVRSHEHARWHGQAERPSGLKVDDRFVLSRCLHWKVGGLNTTQDAVDIGRSLPKLIDAVDAVAQETTGRDEETVRIDCRQAMPGRERDEKIAVN